MAILYAFAAPCLFDVVFLHRAKQDRSLCAVTLTNLPRIKEPRTDSPWKRQILKARSVSYLLSSSWVLRCVSCGQKFLTFLVLGYLTCSQEPRWLRVAWWTRTFYIRSFIWIIPNRLRAISRLSEGFFMFCHVILITQIPWVYVRVHHATRSHRGSWAHVR